MKLIEIDGVEHFEFQGPTGWVKVSIDFKSRNNLGGKGHLLARAIGKKRDFILDLTAGLGRDALHLAELAVEVVSIERNVLLSEALSRAWAKSGRKEKLQFVCAEALHYLQSLERTPDVIFYDPMFPAKTKSALAGKESQLLQQLASPDSHDEEQEVVRLSLKKGPHRVVVKRPRGAPPIQEDPDIQFAGKSVRYDVYLPHRHEA